MQVGLARVLRARCVGVLSQSSRGAGAPAAGARWASGGAWHAAPITVEFPSAAPQHRVEEAIVNVTFVNYAGERTKLPGLVGETLFALARRHAYAHMDSGCGGGGSSADQLHKEGGWYEPKYGEGAQCHFCHVIVPKTHYAALPPKRDDELEQLRSYPFPEDMTHTSRLACQITLTREMDNIVIYLPDGPPSIDI